MKTRSILALAALAAGFAAPAGAQIQRCRGPHGLTFADGGCPPGTSPVEAPTTFNMRCAASSPCSAANWKKKAAIWSLRSTPRPLAYIHPRLYCAWASPRRAPLQYRAVARTGSRGTPSPCS